MTKINYYRLINIEEPKTEGGELILTKISKLYSNNYGYWISGDRVTLSLKSLLKLHKGEDICLAYNEEEEIIGFISIIRRNDDKIILITSGCVMKEYRDTGILKSLISYVLEEYKPAFLGVISPNPIFLWTLETLPNTSYINLEEEVCKNKLLGVYLSIIIDEIRRKSYGILNKPYKRVDKINYKKIRTEFTIKTPEEDLKLGCKDLGKFYSNLMGDLEPGEEWLLFVKYGT